MTNDDPPRSKEEYLSLAVKFFLVLSFLVISFEAINGLIRGNVFFGDFLTYFTASEVFLTGEDPYSLAVLETIDERVRLPLVYPPLVLFCFSFLVPLGYPIVTGLYIAASILSLAFVYTAQVQLVPLSIRGWWLPSFYLFAFSAAAFQSFMTGNLAVVLYALLFTSLLALKRGRSSLFYAAVLVAASVKIYLIIFLLLAPLCLGRRETKKVVLVAFLLALEYGISYVAFPELFSKFIEQAGWLATVDVGRGVFGLAMRVIEAVDSKTGVKLPVFLAYAAYAAFAATILLVSLLAAKRSVQVSGEAARLDLLPFFVVAVFLCLPRLKMYDIFAVVLPLVGMVTRHLSTGVYRPSLGAILVVLAAVPFSTRFQDEIFLVFGQHAEFWIMLTAWLLVVRRCFHGGARPA